MGSKKKPFYRIVAADSRNARDGRFIETLGYYDPMTEPANVNIKEDLIFKWMERGAQPSKNTESILRKAGIVKKWALLKQGVSMEQLEAKYEELTAKETPPMSTEEREKKVQAKAAAKEAEVPSGAEAQVEAEAPAEAEAAPKEEAPAEAPAEAEAAPKEESPAEAPAEADAAPEDEAKTEEPAAQAPAEAEDETKKES